MRGGNWNEISGSTVCMADRGATAKSSAAPINGHQGERDDIRDAIRIIARQMLERHGPGAIAQAAKNAMACESKGDAEEANEWRHIEDAMKMMRGPHQS